MDVWCHTVGNVYIWRGAMDRIKWDTNLAQDWSRRREVTPAWSMPAWHVSAYVAGNECDSAEVQSALMHINFIYLLKCYFTERMKPSKVKCKYMERLIQHFFILYPCIHLAKWQLLDTESCRTVCCEAFTMVTIIYFISVN